MPEVDFTIDLATGELTAHVRGITGPACADITKLASELLGTPDHEWQTPEYYLRPQVRSHVYRKGQA